MKRFLLTLFFILCAVGKVMANPYDLLYEDYIAVYSPQTQTWSAGGVADDKIVLTKKVVESAGAYSQYYHENGDLAFTLTSDCEFIRDGVLVSVNNNELKYSKIIYDGKTFFDQPMTAAELEDLFPELDIVKISHFHNNKIAVFKLFFKKKYILLVNDTDRYFHSLTSQTKNVQRSDIRGLLVLNHYKTYKFEHYGEKDGKLKIRTKW